MSEIMPVDSGDIGDTIKKLQSSTASLVKASNQMPLIGDGFELYATFPQFNQFMHTQRNRIANVLRKISSEAGLKSLKINDRSLEDITQIISVSDRLVDNIVRNFDEHEAKLNEDRVNVRKIDLGAECISGATATSSEGNTHISSKIIRRTYNQFEKQINVKVPEQSTDYKELLNGRQLNNRQIFALEQLWRWREVTAKEHDKSLYYVLPDHMMLKIAEILPREQSGILACCAPVPRLVRHELESLARILKIARELPLEQTTINNLNKLSKQNGIDEFSKLNNCVNGLKAKLEYRFDISKYLNNEEEKNKRNLGFDKNELEGGEKEKQIKNNESKELRRILLSGNIEELETKKSNSCKEKALNIQEYLEQQWASPYETYLVAMMDSENKKIENENKFIQKQTTINKNKREYSHLDENKEEEEEKEGEEDIQIIEEKKIKIENKIFGLDEDEEIKEEREFFADPSNLTKKAKKKLFQKLRKSADIQLC
uniref:HRDC domain-containing protein n=1 Tax=Meloidogyne incognita TaxID=6306 RepID=A0A914NS20_MELIC